MEAQIVKPSEFKLSRKSAYLKSLLDPFSGAASVPDDVTAPHVTKSETITANLTPYIAANNTTSSGIILAYLNHPTSYVAAHYVYNPNAGRYVFQTYLKTAQDLTKSYDYARAVSAGLKIISNTISTTNFTISGTFNAVTIDGSLTEIGFNPETQTPDDFYGTLLSATNVLRNKIGNVLMSHGLVAIGLPSSFNIPFNRLSDPFPTQNTTGLGNSNILTEVVDNSAELIYTSKIVTSVNNRTWVYGGSYYMTVDSFTGPISVTTAISFRDPTLIASAQVGLQFELFSPFGELIESANTEGTFFVGASVDMTYDFVPEAPVGRVKITLSSVAQAAQDLPNIASVVFLVRIPNGARPGIQQPTTVIAYTGFPQDAKLTVSGVKNFELIPNPELRKNLATYYSHYDPDELTYVKKILSHADDIMLRTVMSLPMYGQQQPIGNELSRLDKHDLAEAFDWGSLVRGIKTLAVPALKAFIPEATPFIDMADNITDKLIGKAASGYYGSACDTIIEVDEESEDDSHHRDCEIKAYAADDVISITSSMVNSDDYSPEYPINPATSVLESPTIKFFRNIDSSEFRKAVLFPVVLTRDGIGKKFALYAAIPGLRQDLVSDKAFKFRTNDGRTILNYCGSRYEMPPLSRDYTLVLVQSFTAYALQVTKDSPVVEGSSCQTALKMLDLLMHDNNPQRLGVYGPVTGGFDKDQCLPNLMYFEKASYCNHLGLNLIGSRYKTTPKNAVMNMLVADHANRMQVVRTLNTAPASLDSGVAFEVAVAADDLVKFGDMLKQMQTFMEQSNNATNKRFEMLEKRLLRDEVSEPAPTPAPRPLPRLPRTTNRQQSESPVRDKHSVTFSRDLDDEFPSEFKDRIRTILGAGFTFADIMTGLDNVFPAERVKKGKGLTTEVARQQSAIKKAESSGVDQEWILANGNKGMTQDQIKYYQATGEMPPPSPTVRGRYFKGTPYMALGGITKTDGTLTKPQNLDQIKRSKSANRKDTPENKVKRWAFAQTGSETSPFYGLYDTFVSFGEFLGKPPNDIQQRAFNNYLETRQRPTNPDVADWLADEASILPPSKKAPKTSPGVPQKPGVLPTAAKSTAQPTASAIARARQRQQEAAREYMKALTPFDSEDDFDDATEE